MKYYWLKEANWGFARGKVYCLPYARLLGLNGYELVIDYEVPMTPDTQVAVRLLLPWWRAWRHRRDLSKTVVTKSPAEDAHARKHPDLGFVWNVTPD